MQVQRYAVKDILIRSRLALLCSLELKWPEAIQEDTQLHYEKVWDM